MVIKNKKGFGLMELILSVAILAIISLVVFLSVNSEDKIGRAQDAKRAEDLARISRAIELYQLDNDQLPESFYLEDLAQGEKRVLCSSVATLTCDGQSLSCVVVAGDFLAKYLSDLPVDPIKTSALDSGYYISRQGDRQIVFGACQSYGAAIELIARAALPDYVPSAYCGDAICNGEENCQTCPDDCGACPVYYYHIVQGSDDWTELIGEGISDSLDLIEAMQNFLVLPAAISFAYGDIDTESIDEAADILEATLYFYIDSYTTSAPKGQAHPTKEFYVKMYYNSDWNIIHSGTFLAAGWYYYELTSEQLAHINKTGKTRIMIGVEEPEAEKSRTMKIRAYEYNPDGENSMYLEVAVLE